MLLRKVQQRCLLVLLSVVAKSTQIPLQVVCVAHHCSCLFVLVAVHVRDRRLWTAAERRARYLWRPQPCGGAHQRTNHHFASRRCVGFSIVRWVFACIHCERFRLVCVLVRCCPSLCLRSLLIFNCWCCFDCRNCAGSCQHCRQRHHNCEFLPAIVCL